MKILKRLTILSIFCVLASCNNKNEDLTSNQDLNTQQNLKAKGGGKNNYVITDRKVLLIGIDGCRPDALTAANTPNIDALIANGTYSLDARQEGITISGPGWTSMLTGVIGEKHGVTDNSFNGYNANTYPHFFDRITESTARNSNHLVSIAQWHPINDKIVRRTADNKINASSEQDVVNNAVTQLATEELTAIYVGFDNVDHAGHASGFSPTNPNYISAIESVDSSVGSVLAALYARPNYNQENWLILLSTDHGGENLLHGGTTDVHRNIFVIASGNDIPNQEIAATTSQVTVPPASNCLNSNDELWLENAYVQVPNNANFNFGSSQDFSMECRIRSTNPADVHIVGNKDWDTGLNKGYLFSFSTGNDNIKVNIGDGSNRVDVNGGVITDNEWHTISATFDRDGLLKLYVDGTLVDSASMSSIGDINNALPFTIGADGDLNYKYKGYIAEVRLFNTLLDASDIDTWKCQVLNNTHPKYSNIVGHWKVTEGSGTTIADSSSNGHNGTLTNGEWRDANSSTVITTKNYDNTPRIEDVAVTALTHLCIPIKPEWNLDGNSIIPSCSN